MNTRKHTRKHTKSVRGKNKKEKPDNKNIKFYTQINEGKKRFKTLSKK